jgi:hypothetical protein
MTLVSNIELFLLHYLDGWCNTLVYSYVLSPSKGVYASRILTAPTKDPSPKQSTPSG